MGADIFYLGIRRVIDISSDVKVKIIFFYLFKVHKPRIFRDLELVVENHDDLFDILRPEVILISSLAVFPIGIDEQNPVFHMFRLVFVDDYYARGNAYVIKQLWR